MPRNVCTPCWFRECEDGFTGPVCDGWVHTSPTLRLPCDCTCPKKENAVPNTPTPDDTGAIADIDLRADSPRVTIDGFDLDPKHIVANSVSIEAGPTEHATLRVSFYITDLRLITPDGALITQSPAAGLNLVKSDETERL
ncbi:MAG TPA: hypothetical protein VIT65_13855 [Microlunatus sp.]